MTVTPSIAVAAAAVTRWPRRLTWSASGIVASITTLPAVMLRVIIEAGTMAARARLSLIRFCRVASKS